MLLLFLNSKYIEGVRAKTASVYDFAFLKFCSKMLIFRIQTCIYVDFIAWHFFPGLCFIFEKTCMQKTQFFLAVLFGDLLLKTEAYFVACLTKDLQTRIFPSSLKLLSVKDSYLRLCEQDISSFVAIRHKHVSDAGNDMY